MAEHLKQYQFKKGQSGNPKGRPPNGMQRFVTEFYSELGVQTPKLVKNAFKHGQKRPIPFIRDLVIAMMPKDMVVKATDSDGKVAVWNLLTSVGIIPEAGATAVVPPAIDVDSKEVPDAGNP